MKHDSLRAGAALLLTLTSSVSAAAQQPSPPPDVTVTGHSFLPELRPFDDALVARLRVPDGFAVRVFARDLENARILAVAPGGAVYVTRPAQNDVLLLQDTNGDGEADRRTTAVSGLEKVHGIALHEGSAFLAAPTTVWSARIADDGTFTDVRVLVDDLPDGGQHPNRTMRVHDGWLWISVGSTCNACPEPNPEHATMLRMRLDGSGREVYARGLRNTVGFDFSADGTLWGADHGSDWRGDEVPPEELNRIVQGRDYGWPFCYADRVVDRVIAQAPEDGTKEDHCARSEPAVLTWQAHSAPMQMTFYSGAMFPAEYRGDAFVAMRGSWNRRPAVGYAVNRIRFENGSPAGVEEFVGGFLIDDGAAHFGRPVGISVGADGALLFSDDTNGVIYRVTHGS